MALNGDSLDGDQLSVDDPFILVMGMSGVGKSTFVQACVQTWTTIGHGLDASTMGPSIHTAHVLGRPFHLIDTPGFDDNHRSDALVLNEIAFWVREASEAGMWITGIIYLHPIAVPRLSGSARRGLELFKHVCGPAAYPGVVLLTTGWDSIESGTRDWELARQRQQELEGWFWADIIEAGGTALPLRDTITPFAVVRAIALENRRLTLALQEKLKHRICSLAETAAGRFLLSQYEVEREKGENALLEVRDSLREAQREIHGMNISRAQESLDEINNNMASTNGGINDLHADLRDMTRRESVRIAHQRRILVATVPAELTAEEEELQGGRRGRGGESFPSRVVIPRSKATELVKAMRLQQLHHLASRVVTKLPKAERVSAVAAIAGASIAAAALCTLM